MSSGRRCAGCRPVVAARRIRLADGDEPHATAEVVGADPRPVAAERRSGVVADERPAVAPGVPRPGLVAHMMRGGPGDDSRDVAGTAVGAGVALADLAEDDRHPA